MRWEDRNPEQFDESIKMYYDEYKTFEELAEILNISSSTIQLAFNRYNIKARSRNAPLYTYKFGDKIIELVNNKYSADQIVEELNISRSALFKITKQFGIKIPNYKRGRKKKSN